MLQDMAVCIDLRKRPLNITQEYFYFRIFWTFYKKNVLLNRNQTVSFLLFLHLNSLPRAYIFKTRNVLRVLMLFKILGILV